MLSTCDFNTKKLSKIISSSLKCKFDYFPNALQEIKALSLNNQFYTKNIFDTQIFDWNWLKETFTLFCVIYFLNIKTGC